MSRTSQGIEWADRVNMLRMRVTDEQLNCGPSCGVTAISFRSGVSLPRAVGW
jgi:hypothetical protein